MARPPAGKGTAAAAPAAGNRRDRLASLEAERRAEQRRRRLGLLAICVVVALALLAYPVYLVANEAVMASRSITEIGVSPAAAACEAPQQNPATGNQQHVPNGTKVPYPQTPPDSGPHYPEWAPFAKKFYTVTDRPAVENLVHNLEHGYLVVWYRDTLPKSQVDDLQAIAKTFRGDTRADKFIAAPWATADGAGFPAGKNVVLARWYANPDQPGNTSLQKGISEPCGAVSGAVIKSFMTAYPPTAAPEPNGG